MGYTTSFFGKIRIHPSLNEAEVKYLRRFSDSRRMHVREGPYFVDQPGPGGQDDGPNVINMNGPPPGQPGLWCQWVPVDGGAALAWDGSEKFYDADQWMQYLIDHFLRPGAQAAALASAAAPHGGLGEVIPLFRPRPSSAGARSTQPASQFADFTFDHHLNGTILASGQQYPDLWRLDVRDNQVTVGHYPPPEEFPEELEDGPYWWDVIYALETKPQVAMQRMDAFLDAVPEGHAEHVGLNRFLRDLCEVLDPPRQQALAALLACRGW